MRKIFLFVILILISILSLTASLDSGKMPLGTEPIRRVIKNERKKINQIKKENLKNEYKKN